MTKAMTKAQNTTAMATYADEAVETYDELDKDSFAIPRIAVVEKLSPELEEGDAAYIPEAKPGMLANKTMGEVYPSDPGILVIPVQRRRVFLEWVPRGSGGGFAAEHNVEDGEVLMESTERNEKNIDMLENGNELHNVLEFYVLASPDAGVTWAPGIISMSRTRMAEGKRWNTRINNFMRDGKKITPLAQVYSLTTAKRDNPEGVSYVFKLGNATFLPEAVEDDADVFAQAKSFLDAIHSGTAQINRDEEANAENIKQEEF